MSYYLCPCTLSHLQCPIIAAFKLKEVYCVLVHLIIFYFPCSGEMWRAEAYDPMPIVVLCCSSFVVFPRGSFCSLAVNSIIVWFIRFSCGCLSPPVQPSGLGQVLGVRHSSVAKGQGGPAGGRCGRRRYHFHGRLGQYWGSIGAALA